MIRDPGLIQSLGSGVTTRDIPFNESETRGVSPNSGYVNSALNGHPVMRFVATTAATLAVTAIASSVTKKGGLRLAKFLQNKSDESIRLGRNSLATSFINSATSVRRHLDEWEGIRRALGPGDDPYSRLVFETPGGALDTGYSNARRYGYDWFTSEERRVSQITGEPTSAAVWSKRDSIQQNLVKAGRRLPYELPAMYAVQKSVIEPLSNDGNSDKRKVNWYNPIDVVTDFTKQSAINIATMILPFEFAGGAAKGAASSLHTIRYSDANLRTLTGFQQKVHKGVLDVSELLSEVGHDFAGLTDRFLRSAAQSSGSLAEATRVASNANQQGFVQTLHTLKRGADAARQNAIANGRSSPTQVRNAAVSAYLRGYNGSPSIIDLIPSFRGTTEAIRAGRSEFKKVGLAYDVKSGNKSINEVLRTGLIGPDELSQKVNVLKAQHSSKFVKFIGDVDRQIQDGVVNQHGVPIGAMANNIKNQSFKELISSNLVSRGTSRATADLFVKNLQVNPGKGIQDATTIIRMGNVRLHGDALDSSELTQDFFQGILKRFSGIAKVDDMVSADALGSSVRDAQNTFFSREFQLQLANRVRTQWNGVSRSLPETASQFLKPQKALYRDFTGIHNLSASKQQFLQRKTAEVLGIGLKDQNGRRVSDTLVKQGLINKGFDPNNFGDLRAFLIDKKKISKGLFDEGFNLLGLKPVTIDEARERGVFSHLTDSQKATLNRLASRTAMDDPVSGSIGLSNVNGLYQTKHGRILDFTAVTNVIGKAANFASTELKIPILGFNPTDLAAGRSFRQMGNRPSFQYISNLEVQPFLGAEASSGADFYIWSRAGRLGKGKLTAYQANQATGRVYGRQIEGTYRALSTSSTDLLTRQARYAAGTTGDGLDRVRGSSGSRLLDRLFTFAYRDSDEAASRAIAFKERLSIDPEQPNSLFRFIERFRNRGRDINNPSVMARILTGENVTDAAGVPITAVNPGRQFLRAFDDLRDETFRTGMPVQVIKELEDVAPDSFKYLGKSLSDMTSEGEILDFARQVITANRTMANTFRSAGLNDESVRMGISRIQKLVDNGNLSAVSEAFEKSATINTRLDELKNELFRYISQTNAVVNSASSSQSGVFGGLVAVENAITRLTAAGVISSSQKAEAQAAALATLFNVNAFNTYSGTKTITESSRAAVQGMLDALNTDQNLKNLFEPYIEGTIARVGSPLRRRFGGALSSGKRNLGMSGYKIDELSVDPLGTSGGTTLVPTFGTAFARNPKDAIKSVMGIGTYKNQSAYSGSSVPVAHAVERLNRYFGTVGLQLDVNDFGGPLDLFTRGMIGKRVAPLFAAGIGLSTIDRTLGGYLNGQKDVDGNRIYSPFFMGMAGRAGVELSAFASQLNPGGMNYQEKKEQLMEGEVPIRQGRFWPLGNTPFRGGKVMYYRPSWYRKMQGAAMYTEDTYGTPIERALFYTDVSPLRPFDPYRFERKHYRDRPYPVTGEYFSGPFGPLTPIMNATIGKILKPQLMMHENEVSNALSQYVNTGTSGAYDSSVYSQAGSQGSVSVGGGGMSGAVMSRNVSGAGAFGVVGYNQSMAANAANARNTASNLVVGSASQVNASYLDASQYGPPKVLSVMTPQIVGAGPTIDPASFGYQSGEIGYRLQEMAGIYGFSFASARGMLGLGNNDFEPDRTVLQSAAKAYGSSRAFWDLNLGGLGDVPLPSREALGNLEFSEIVRRFIPKDRKNVDYLNPIKNTMGSQYPFLPGSEYFTDFTTGDPFTKVQEGELRLPGVGYERFNTLYGDGYGPVNQLDILADVAPYSKKFKMLDRKIGGMDLSPAERIKVEEIRNQVADTTKKYQFDEYQYAESSPEEQGMHPTLFGMARVGEYIAHSDNFVINKIMGRRTAIEDWERRNVYGATFPEWSRPFESYIRPMIDKSTQENPISAAATLGAVGAMFGRTPRATILGTTVGAATGGISSIFGNAYEAITGERYIPKRRKEELALEEYNDILSYVKNTRLASRAQAEGDARGAFQFRMAAKRTMYGADIYSGDIEQLAFAIPKRKREHFTEMINEQDQGKREKILSTAGRLERRVYQAAWGMRVEERPDLEEYFEKHELPGDEWEGWHQNTNMDHVKIKMGQSMGIEMSQMGYYPQQIKQANLANPSYPDFFQGTGQSTLQRIKDLMKKMGLSGSVQSSPNPYGSDQVNTYAGIGM